MTHQEAKLAFYHKIPVEYDGIQYPYIQALRYVQQAKDRESAVPIMQLELLDPGKNSVVLTSPKKVSMLEGLPEGKLLEDGETLYEWQGIRMVKNKEEYVVIGPEGTVRATKNLLAAWTSFSDLLDSRVRRQIGEELLVQKRNRYTAEEEAV